MTTDRDTDDWRTSTLALTICGASGAGKTTTARCLHHEWPGTSILFDLDHEPNFGRVVQSTDELCSELQSGTRRIAVRPPETVVSDPDLFEDTVRVLLRLGNSLRDRGTGRVQFLMDEAQDLDSKWVQVAMKRLRKRRIKPVALTQDPVSLDNRVRTVADFNGWLSPPPSKMADTLRQIGYPVDLLEELPHYDMLVLGENWQPVTRFRANEEYAE